MSGSLEIRELAGDERVLTLRERGLPERPMKFGGKHNLVETSYAGSPNTGQQALGASEIPSTFRGEWNDKFLGDRDVGTLPMAEVTAASSEVIEGLEVLAISNNAITTAAELARLVDDMRTRGMPVRVSIWHLSRIGRISEFRHEWDTEHDVRWEIDFAWIGQDEQEGLPSPTAPDNARTTAALGAKVDIITEALSFEAVDELDPGFVEDVDRAIGEIQASIAVSGDAVRAAADGIAAPIETTRRALATMSLLREQADELVITIEGHVSGAITVVDDIDDLTTVPAHVQVAIECGQRRAARAARALRQEAALRRRAALDSLDGDVLDVVIAREGEDLRLLARRYYGNASDWEPIRSYNGFTSSALEVGDVVIIPALGAQR